MAGGGISVLGIVGAGVMGRGIAQVAAEAGLTVLLADARSEAVAEAVAFSAGLIRRKAEKGTIPAAEAEAAIARLVASEAGPGQGYAAFGPCDLVIEAVAERMEIKHGVRDALEAVVRPDCIIATNTSSLSVTGFAAGAAHPERIAGFHFFNPVPLMRIVEVIGGARTAPGTVDALVGLARRMGHRPVICADTPGFLVNHAGRGFTTEALRILQEGIAGVAAIDRIMTGAAGFRLGPFELLDLTGLDVSHKVMESIYRQFYDEPRFRPVPLTAQRHAAGLFGRKTGQGFYTYADGRAVKPPAPERPSPAVLPPVWVSPRETDVAARVRAVLQATGAVVETGERPSGAALIVVTPFGHDTTTTALAEGLDPERTVALDGLLPLERWRTLMCTPVTRPGMRDAALALLSRDGVPVEAIHDSPGFVAQRILAAIVNIGADIAQQRIAAPEDIDAAVELALGYPKGPLALGDALGPARVTAILDAMHAFYGDPRYRVSPWLRRRAMLGVSLLTPEG